MAEIKLDDLSTGEERFQGWTAAEIALEYGHPVTRTHVDSHAKADFDASPASFPKIGPAQHQHADGGPSDETSLCCGQSPGPELVARRYRQFLEDGGGPGRDPASYGDQFDR